MPARDDEVVRQKQVWERKGVAEVREGSCGAYDAFDGGAVVR